MIKRLSVIPMLLILLINLGGTYPMFKWEQWHVRREIKRRIKDSVPEWELDVISFSKNVPINWIREGKEFRFKGKMYDVVRSSETKDSLTFYCINDNQEQHLFAHLDECVKAVVGSSSRSHTNAGRSVLKHFMSMIYLPPVSIVSSPNDSVKLCECVYLNLYSDAFVVNNVPPPKIIA